MSAPWRASPEEEMESWVSFRDGERERARLVSAPLGGEALRLDIEDVTGEVTGERGRAGPGSSPVGRWRAARASYGAVAGFSSTTQYLRRRAFQAPPERDTARYPSSLTKITRHHLENDSGPSLWGL
jgi:hypothetical protein